MPLLATAAIELLLSSLAQLPARVDDRVVRGPPNHSGVCSTGRATASRVSCTAHGQEIVSALGGKCVDCERDIPCVNAARLVVAIVCRMVLALNAIACHLATISDNLPSARGRSGWLRSRRRSWSGNGGNWLHTTLLHDPINVGGYSRPHAWIRRVGTTIPPRCRTLHVPEAAVLANQWAAAVALASIGCASIVVAIGAEHVIGDSLRGIIAVTLRIRLDIHYRLLEDSGAITS